MKRLPKLLLLLVTSFVCVVALELALRIIAPVPDLNAEDKLPRQAINQYIKSEFPKNLRLKTQPEPGLPGVTGPNVFTTNALGFRGDPLSLPKPANEFR